MKRVLSIQDLSCLGKCSLTVALPVLSAMGCACTALPTAVLSTHTAFPAPHVRSLTQDLVPICRHWQHVGAQFDAISVGYLSDPAQAAAVETVLDAFDAVKVIDPAMGDHGRLYSGLTADHVTAMAQLCRKGNILLPNVTEACLLTGIPYRETTDAEYYRTLLTGMLDFGADTVILTGAALAADKTGFMGMDRHAGEFSYQANRIAKQCHGTGDLFTAVFTGAYIKEHAVTEAAAQAAAFVETVLAATPAASPFGLEFEAQLSVLWNDAT